MIEGHRFHEETQSCIESHGSCHNIPQMETMITESMTESAVARFTLSGECPRRVVVTKPVEFIWTESAFPEENRSTDRVRGTCVYVCMDVQ